MEIHPSTILLGIVIYTNFLDYLLLTAVVPIVPELLVEVDVKDLESKILAENKNATSIQINTSEIIALLNETTIINTTTEMGTMIHKFFHIPIQAINENSKVGYLLGSKALTQMAANPVVGYVSNRIKYKTILIFGTCVFFISATLFAAAESFTPLLIARASQGFGSAATTIAGMSMVAEHYSQDQERSSAMGFAMGGLALGILVGYPYGGVLFALTGKAPPFIGIAVMCLINLGLQYFVLEDVVGQFQMKRMSTSFRKLLTDPYILICAGAICITSMSLAVLESTVPIWVMDNMEIQQWQLGLIFIPDSVGYLFGTNVFPVIAQKYGRWLFAIISIFLISIAMLAIPFSKSIDHLLVPHLLLGLGVGVTDAAIMPLLALLVDQRHVASYGSVYAIVQFSVCLAYSLGPVIAGQVSKLAGFKWSMWGMTIFNLAFMPLCYFLKSPPVTGDSKPFMADVNVKDCTDSISEERVLATYKTFDSTQ